MTNFNLAGLLITLILFFEFTKNREHKNLITMKGGKVDETTVDEGNGEDKAKAAEDKDEETEGWSYVLFTNSNIFQYSNNNMLFFIRLFN